MRLCSRAPRMTMRSLAMAVTIHSCRALARTQPRGAPVEAPGASYEPVAIAPAAIDREARRGRRAAGCARRRCRANAEAQAAEKVDRRGDGMRGRRQRERSPPSPRLPSGSATPGRAASSMNATNPSPAPAAVACGVARSLQQASTAAGASARGGETERRRRRASRLPRDLGRSRPPRHGDHARTASRRCTIRAARRRRTPGRPPELAQADAAAAERGPPRASQVSTDR